MEDDESFDELFAVFLGGTLENQLQDSNSKNNKL